MRRIIGSWPSEGLIACTKTLTTKVTNPFDSRWSLRTGVDVLPRGSQATRPFFEMVNVVPDPGVLSRKKALKNIRYF